MDETFPISDVEPACSWLNKLADKADGDQLFPEEYALEEVASLATRVSEKTLSRRNELHLEAGVEKHTAQMLALEEIGLTPAGIAVTMTLAGDDFEVVDPDEVGECVRRVRQRDLAVESVSKEAGGSPPAH